MIRFALYILFFLSGAAALGYQLVWSKMFSTGLGHEMPAVLAIICAFMAGMALGSFVLDRFVPRDAHAGRWLAALELVVGLWAIFISLMIPHVNEFALRIIGLEPGAAKHWLVAFAIPAFVLLPATAAMGATLPAMEKFLSAVVPRNESVGSVYAANTLGAVAGTLLTPFVLMPRFGFRDACWVLAGLNIVAAVGALVLARRASFKERGVSKKIRADSAVRAPFSSHRIAVTLFLTGLLGIGYEVAGVRVLTQVLEGTVFTYAAVLAIFLLGTATGAGTYHRWWRHLEPKQLLARLCWALGVTALIGVFALSCTKPIYKLARGFGDTPFHVFAAEFSTAAVVFALPTIFMGALFSHLAQLARERCGRIGGVLALNTMGAALAPAVFGVMLIPLIGTKWTLMFIAVAYLVLGLPRLKFALTALPFLWLTANADLQVIDKPEGSKVIAYREGVMASVAVVKDSDGARTLRVDNRFQMGGTAAADAERRQSHIPLLLHPAPRRALFLGVGTGISFGAASLHPGLEADGVELVPEVIAALPAFEPFNFAPTQQPNLKLHVADARRFVRTSEERYDVIVADVFHPYRDGAGALYTREHFAAIRERLDTNGLFCQWLPLHQLDDGTLRIITHTFLTIFPDAEAWLLRFNVDVPVLGLIGRKGATSYSNNWIEARIQGTPVADAMKRLSLADSVRFFGHFLAGRDELWEFADRTSINTDDNQEVTFAAPRVMYQREAKPYASLRKLMDSKGPHRDDGLPSLGSDHEFAAKVLPYCHARDIYLRGLVHDAERRHDEALDAYIESARLSPDFTTGYAQAINFANSIANSEPVKARRILERLIEARPEVPVAGLMLKRLFGP